MLPAQPITTDLSTLPEAWAWAGIEQVCDVLSGFAFSSANFSGQGVPVTKIANIGYGVYEVGTEQEYLDPRFLKENCEFTISAGAILIALTRPITNGTLKSCLYPEHLPTSLLNQRVAAVTSVFSALTSYIYLVTRTPYFREAVRNSTSETLQPNMSPNALKTIALPLPSIEEAQKLMELASVQLKEIDSQEAAIGLALKQSTAQRQNILRAAFSGQLVPQDPTDEPASVLLARIRAERAAQGAQPRKRRVAKDAS